LRAGNRRDFLEAQPIVAPARERDRRTAAVGPLSLLRILLVGLEDILVLITGSRRENGGSRRIGRR
jgi:hypothetical protein